MFSDPKGCIPDRESCYLHEPEDMMQIFLLKLAKVHVPGGSVELYGYIAVRDMLDPLLNYVINLSRDDPIIVEQVHICSYCNYFKLLYFSSSF